MVNDSTIHTSSVIRSSRTSSWVLTLRVKRIVIGMDGAYSLLSEHPVNADWPGLELN